MKNIVLSAVAVLAMSSFAVAGGDIAPVEEPVVVVEPVMDDSGFYLGLAYGLANLEAYGEGETVIDDSSNAIMMQAGYKFNSYVAVEGRYWAGLDTSISDIDNDSYDMSIDSWGIYVKPMYPVTDAFDIYALLGYASSEVTFSDGDDSISSGDQDGFSWGIGAAYSFSDSLAVFVDYVSLYDDEPNYAGDHPDDANAEITTWNFGVTYQF